MNLTKYIDDCFKLFNSSTPKNHQHSDQNDKKVLIFSPHPDDEVLMSPIALRLKNENNCQIINIAMTLGSKKERQQERKVELINSCKVLQYDLLFKEKTLIEYLEEIKPFLVILPHQFDQHPTHKKVYQEAWDAIRNYSQNNKIYFALSEFWLPNLHPNLLIELSKEDILQLINALECHIGEIKRNPYHLRYPSYLMDNMRRGQELVGSNIQENLNIIFGQNYEIGFFQNEIMTTHPKKICKKDNDLFLQITR
jgi:LmbE family N-acetylglucosaminyl deacetylase